MPSNLEWLFANDRHALIDWVVCCGDCKNCRAGSYCEEAHEWTHGGDGRTFDGWMLEEHDGEGSDGDRYDALERRIAAIESVLAGGKTKHRSMDGVLE